MAWEKLALTTAENTVNVAFTGRGSIYVEGTFGGGAVHVKPIYVDPTTREKIPSTGFLDDAIDGTDVNSKDVPSGHYQLELNGSSGGAVDVYINDQADHVTT